MLKADTVIVKMSVALCLWTLEPILSSWGHKKSQWLVRLVPQPSVVLHLQLYIVFGVFLTSRVYFLTTRNSGGPEQVASQSKSVCSFEFRLLLLRPARS